MLMFVKFLDVLLIPFREGSLFSNCRFGFQRENKWLLGNNLTIEHCERTKAKTITVKNSKKLSKKL